MQAGFFYAQKNFQLFHFPILSQLERINKNELI
jgi:hypothetical protein